MQILGICRFSYPAIGGFQLEHPTIEDRIEYLYKDEILGFRMKTFELLTLPSIAHQSDTDFTFVILIGDTLPKQARARLEELTCDLAHVHIVALPPLPHREAALKALAPFRDTTHVSVQFRLDDDDAVGRDFVVALRAAAQSAEPLLQTSNKVGIDFNQGYAVRFGPDGLEAELVNRPYLTPALGILMRKSLNKTILHFPHHRFSELMPTLTFPNPPMYLRCFHALNDSTQTRIEPHFNYRSLDKDTDLFMREYFGVDTQKIKAWRASVSGPDRATS